MNLALYLPTTIGMLKENISQKLLTFVPTFG